MGYLLRPWDSQGDSLKICKGKGAYLFSFNGEEYIDFTSGSFNVNFGYSNKHIKQGITNQLKRLPYAQQATITKSREILAKYLVEMTNFQFTKVYICCGGGEAIEAAMIFAKHFTKKTIFISLKGAYHGASENTSKLGKKLNNNDNENTKYISVEAPNCYRCAFNLNLNSCKLECFENMKKAIEKNQKDIAAIFIEPIIGINGYVFIPVKYLALLHNEAKKNDILVVYDEILTGFYRTGKLFAYFHSNTPPDILCFGKGLNSGYIPIGGVMISSRISKYFDSCPLEYGNTNMAHPVSCASAIATIEYMKKCNIEKSIRKKGEILLKSCENLKKKYPLLIGDVRGRGFLYALELVKEKKKSLSRDDMVYLQSMFIQKGVIINLDPTISIIPLAPPFCISRKEIVRTFKIIDNCLNRFRVLIKSPSFFSFPNN